MINHDINYNYDIYIYIFFFFFAGLQKKIYANARVILIQRLWEGR